MKRASRTSRQRSTRGRRRKWEGGPTGGESVFCWKKGTQSRRKKGDNSAVILGMSKKRPEGGGHGKESSKRRVQGNAQNVCIRGKKCWSLQILWLKRKRSDHRRTANAGGHRGRGIGGATSDTCVGWPAAGLARLNGSLRFQEKRKGRVCRPRHPWRAVGRRKGARKRKANEASFLTQRSSRKIKKERVNE